MSKTAQILRRRTLLWLTGGALLATLLGGASLMPAGQPAARVEAGQLVLPDFAGHAGDVRLIMSTTTEEFYHLVNDPKGWVLPEKGGYPVRADRIAALVSALSTMRYDRAMTRDDKKFDRIGLGDPAAGGSGALLEVGDGHGNSFARLIVGYRNGRTYVRQPDDLQAWAVTLPEGAEPMPPLQRGARWLDLEAVEIPAADISEVEVRPGLGLYRLLPADDTGQRFALAPPNHNRPAPGFALNLIAQALTRFSPEDVARADTLKLGIPAALHITRTKTGLGVIATAWRTGDRGWVTLVASALSGAAADVPAQAEAINARTSGWAFAMSENDWGAFVTPLETLAPR